MKKYLFITIIFSLFCSQFFAQNVSLEEAIVVANNKINIELKNAEKDLIIKAVEYIKDENGNTSIYIINYTEKMYVLVPSYKCYYPIIAYSLEKNFNYETAAVPFKGILLSISSYISKNKDNIEAVSIEVANEWNFYSNSQLKSESTITQLAIYQTVETPLLKTKWRGDMGYNKRCPIDNSTGGRSEAGCIAVAMAQIMAYYKYPTSGFGEKEYYTKTNNFFTKANFGETEYKYENLVLNGFLLSDEDFYNNPTEYSAQLIHHAGVSVEMDYNGNVENGRKASSLSELLTTEQKYQKIVDAFENTFSYSQGIHYLFKNDYDETNWILMLRNELLSNRPVLYFGYSEPSIGSNIHYGHAFVIDGVRNHCEFHMNWGWGENGDWLKLSQMTNISEYGFNFLQDQAAIFGITPYCLDEIKLNSDKLFDRLKVISPHEFRTEGIISSNIPLESNSNEVYYQSKTKVVLHSGFKVDNGVTFRADGRGCIPSKRNGNGKPEKEDPNEIIYDTWASDEEWKNIYKTNPYAYCQVYNDRTWCKEKLGLYAYCKYDIYRHMSLGDSDCSGGVYVPSALCPTCKTHEELPTFQLIIQDSSAFIHTKQKIYIYPNPAYDIVNIEVEQNQTVLKIYNSIGILEKKYTLKKGVNNINIISLKNGLYIFEFSNGSEIMDFKVLKN